MLPATLVGSKRMPWGFCKLSNFNFLEVMADMFRKAGARQQYAIRVLDGPGKRIDLDGQLKFHIRELIKNFVGNTETLLEGLLIQLWQQVQFPEIRDQPFRIHIPHQFIPRHRAASDAFQGAVESSASCLKAASILAFQFLCVEWRWTPIWQPGNCRTR